MQNHPPTAEAMVDDQRVCTDGSFRLSPLLATTNPSQKRTHHKHHRIARNTRANIKIGSLNMRGHGGQLTNLYSTKWNAINALLRHQKLGVLAIQETHLDNTTANRINDIFGHRMHIIHSPSPAAGQAQGVAWILNREITNTTGYTVKELIPGRALLIVLPWHNDLKLKLLNVYAPNPPAENAAFWTELHETWTTHHLPRPDLLVGDFNIVEDAIDRLPASQDSTEAVTALIRFRHSLGLFDGWRETFPYTKTFSFLTPNGSSQSRLDRIYATNHIRATASEWTITPTAVITDHNLVSVRISHKELPFIGHGRWTIPLHLLDDSKFLNIVTTAATTLYQKICMPRPQNEPPTNDPTSPQKLYANFKRDVIDCARKRTFQMLPKTTRTIRALRSDLHKTLNGPQPTPDDLITAGILHTKIAALEAEQQARARTSAAARFWTEGESISHYWSQLHKPRTPRDIIYSLRLPDTPPTSAARRSDHMASLTRNYHDQLQAHTPLDHDRTTALDTTIKSITTPLRRDSDHWESLDSPLSTAEIAIAINTADNNKSSGLDGIPYELWKALQDRYEALDDTVKQQATTLNPAQLLAALFNNIRTHGVDESTQFAKGWMCPIFKKKDREVISNYRPITVLNADYKIFTKVLTTRLLKAIPLLVHPDQAGFIPGRQIHDQIQLTKMLTHYGERFNDKGAILSLDQEKAYDRVAHDYLWATLQAFNLPPSFVKTIQSLYAAASTVVIINGVISPPYQVTRGVRQGDPLSCPVFDLAIEPLACMLRQSQLRGFPLPGLPARLITSLFADDTCVYLSRHDDINALYSILTTWCTASTAKFNNEKAVLIPVGPKKYRDKLIRRRRLHKQANPLPDDLHIAQDGEPTRILGAWVGNNIDSTVPWAATLDKIATALTRWSRFAPSLKGKRLIVQMIVGGMSQYLTKAQGMPTNTEHTLIAMIRDFIHGFHKHPLINYETLCLPQSQGGLELLHIPARNEAIELMWLRSYLTLNSHRPTWAALADVLIGESVTKASGTISSWDKINFFLQSWDVGTHSRSTLPTDLRRMLRVAKKYNVAFDTAVLSKETSHALRPTCLNDISCNAN